MWNPQRIVTFGASVTLALWVCGLVTTSCAEAAGTIVTFDPPGSTDTSSLAINSHDTVAGWFLDSSSVEHGYVRTSDGTITTFDAPHSRETQVWAMNNKGLVVGEFYQKGTHARVCFVRKPDGQFRTINPSSAPLCIASGINNTNTIAGYSGDQTGTISGFVDSEGAVTTFAVSGAVYTEPTAINDVGTVTGGYAGSDGITHGFVRSTDGTLVTFGVPNATYTRPIAINANGVVVGDYVTQKEGDYAFIRDPDGTITTFHYGHGYTIATAITKAGRITGPRVAKGNEEVGFIRSPDGSEHYNFNPGDGVYPTSINDHGAITGIYGRGTSHGFIRFPG